MRAPRGGASRIFKYIYIYMEICALRKQKNKSIKMRHPPQFDLNFGRQITVIDMRAPRGASRIKYIKMRDPRALHNSKTIKYGRRRIRIDLNFGK